MPLELLGSSGEGWIFQSSEGSGNLFRIRVVQHSTNSTHTKEKGIQRKQKNTLGLCIPQLLESGICCKWGTFARG